MTGCGPEKSDTANAMVVVSLKCVLQTHTNEYLYSNKQT